MPLPAFTLRRADDWVALYSPTGQRIAEGHSLDVQQVFAAIGLRLDTQEFADKFDDESENEYDARLDNYFPEAI